MIKECEVGTGDYNSLSHGEPFISHVLDEATLDNYTESIGMSYADFDRLIETNISLPMLEDEESVSETMAIIGTLCDGESQGEISPDVESDSLGDG